MPDRRNNQNPNGDPWYNQNHDYQHPDYQHLPNTASQYGQNSGYQNPVGSKQQNDRQSYPQESISTGPPLNLTFIKASPEINPFTESPDMRKAYDLISSQQPTDSKQRNYFRSVTIQKINSYNVSPNSTNIYGSINKISGPQLSPEEEDFLDRIGEQSLSLGDSEPKTLQTRDDKVANLYGAATYQTNTAYTSQSQHSTQQSIGSRQNTNTQRLTQECPEVQQLQSVIICLLMLFFLHSLVFYTEKSKL